MALEMLKFYLMNHKFEVNGKTEIISPQNKFPQTILEYKVK